LDARVVNVGLAQEAPHISGFGISLSFILTSYAEGAQGGSRDKVLYVGTSSTPRVPGCVDRALASHCCIAAVRSSLSRSDRRRLTDSSLALPPALRAANWLCPFSSPLFSNTCLMLQAENERLHANLRTVHRPLTVYLSRQQ
jgi:hypothetical protein